MANARYSERAGYDRLAKLMGHEAGLAIFRRFSTLSAENLLYLQAELVDLELKVQKLQDEDKRSDNTDRANYQFSWDALSSSVDPIADKGNDGRQWQTILEIRKKLKEYHEALLLHQHIDKLTPPSRQQLGALNEWMNRPTMGNIGLIGDDRELWGKSKPSELAVLKWTAEDLVTSRLTSRLMHLYHALLGRYIHEEGDEDYLSNTITYRSDVIFAIVKATMTLLACLLPVVGITVLYLITSMSLRLGVIAIFVAVFTLCLNIFSSASVKDIFSATAAFAAVLVVFIGTNDGGNHSSA